MIFLLYFRYLFIIDFGYSALRSLLHQNSRVFLKTKYKFKLTIIVSFQTEPRVIAYLLSIKQKADIIAEWFL